MYFQYRKLNSFLKVFENFTAVKMGIVDLWILKVYSLVSWQQGMTTMHVSTYPTYHHIELVDSPAVVCDTPDCLTEILT
jgi:ABC-type long-subunit fatty acid transport system fused permease/ATPase subunit